jgi:hypothetical protein
VGRTHEHWVWVPRGRLVAADDADHADALGWYFIVLAGYPDAPAPYRQVLAAYAAGVALNGFLPANIGTFVMLLMFIAIIPGANLPLPVSGGAESPAA